MGLKNMVKTTPRKPPTTAQKGSTMPWKNQIRLKLKLTGVAGRNLATAGVKSTQGMGRRVSGLSRMVPVMAGMPM